METECGLQQCDPLGAPVRPRQKTKPSGCLVERREWHLLFINTGNGGQECQI